MSLDQAFPGFYRVISRRSARFWGERVCGCERLGSIISEARVGGTGRRGKSARLESRSHSFSSSTSTTPAVVSMLSLAPRRAARIVLVRGRPSACLTRSLAPLASSSSRSAVYGYTSTRTFLSWFKSKPKDAGAQGKGKENTPILTEDNLFHPFSQSPFPAIRARGEAIRQLAPCPVCASAGVHAHAHAQPKSVAFECPDCGWPTHCSEEHWEADHEHQKYCARLREVNEDEHDLRSGRRMREFELPGASL